MIDSRFYNLISRLHLGGSHRYYWAPTGGDNNTKASYWINGEVVPVPGVWKNDVYFPVHPLLNKKSTHERGKIGDVAAGNCLFSEFDCDDSTTKADLLTLIESLPLQPSVIVDSGGGYHCYWLFAETFTLDTEEARTRLRRLQYAWVEYVGGDGGAKDLARVLRIPGTYNTKYDSPLLVEFVKCELDTVYHIDAIEKLIQPYVDQLTLDEFTPKSTSVPTITASTTSLDEQELLNKMFASPNGGAIRALWDGDMSSVGNDHSRADETLCCYLAFWFGDSPDAMDRIFRQSQLSRDKWADREDYRDSTISKACQKVVNRYNPDYRSQDQSAIDAANAFVFGSHSTSRNASASTPAGAGIPQWLQDIYLNELAFDEGNAQCVFAKHGQDFCFTDAYGWMHYNGKYWNSDGAESRLKRLVVETLVERRATAVLARDGAIEDASEPNSSKVSSCIALFKSLVHRSVDLFDKRPMLLNCPNGTVDLKTGQIQPHKPDDYLTYCIDVEYDPNVDYTEWLEFLNKAVAHPDMANYLQLAVGYSVTGMTNEECMFYLHGPPRSGKGTFTETLLKVLGKPIGVGADFQTFTAKRDGDTQNFDLAPLKPARMIAAGESKKGEKLNSAKIKQVTGGDYIRCAFKRRDLFEYQPQFKVWLSSNYPVRGDVDDVAFWWRIRIIHFPHSNLGKEDKTLKGKLQSRDGLRGVLAWAVAGAVAWAQSPQGLPVPQQVVDKMNEHRDLLDDIKEWLEEECNASPIPAKSGAYTSTSVLYDQYSNWCRRNNTMPKGRKTFTQSLQSKNYQSDRERVGGKVSRVVYGITLI